MHFLQTEGSWRYIPQEIMSVLLCMQRKWFLEVETAPGEDAAKIVEMATKALKHYTKSVDKGAWGWRGLTPILKEVQLWEK